MPSLTSHYLRIPLAIRLLGTAAIAAALPHAYGVVIYNETTSGDLSNSGLAPTPLTVIPGENEVWGTMGSGANGPDLDYFTFNIPAGFELAALAVLPGTQTGGSVSFIGVQAGNQVTVDPGASDATGLLGWKHFSAGSGNILPDMGLPGLGSTGFIPPLGPGSYAFWLQELGAGPLPYGLDFQVRAQSVPDSAPGLTGCAALAGLMIVQASRRLSRVS